jgi:hypothetical protein
MVFAAVNIAARGLWRSLTARVDRRCAHTQNEAGTKKTFSAERRNITAEMAASIC